MICRILVINLKASHLTIPLQELRVLCSSTFTCISVFPQLSFIFFNFSASFLFFTLMRIFSSLSNVVCNGAFPMAFPVAFAKRKGLYVAKLLPFVTLSTIKKISSGSYESFIIIRSPLLFFSVFLFYRNPHQGFHSRIRKSYSPRGGPPPSSSLMFFLTTLFSVYLIFSKYWNCV